MRIIYEIEFGYILALRTFSYLSSVGGITKPKLALASLHIALCSIFGLYRCDDFEAKIFTISITKKKTAKGQRASVFFKELLA